MSSQLCAFCGQPYERTHHRQLYCTTSHQMEARGLRKTRGENVVVALQAWRLSRNTRAPEAKKIGREAMAEFCAMIDAWNAEDLAAGRLSALKVIPLQKWLEGIPS